MTWRSISDCQGDKYQGMWIDDKMEGPGKYIKVGGKVWEGNFKDNKF